MARFVGGTGIDVYVGTIDIDQISGGDGNDRLFGGLGADAISGGAGNDLLSSNGIVDGFTATLENADSDVDTVNGGDGNDIVAGGWNDRLYGGTGTDVLYLDLRGVDRGVTLDLGRLVAGGTVRIGTGVLSGFEGYASIALTAFDDDIRLGGFRNYGVLGGGVDGGEGNDRIDAGNVGSGGGNQFTAGALRGGNGDDLLIGSNGSDSLRGDSGNDRLIAGNGNDTLYGGAGDDILDLRGTGVKFVVGDDGSDTLLLRGARSAYDVVVYDRDRGIVAIADNAGFEVRLSGIERLRFADGTIAFRDLLPGLVLGTAGDDRIEPGSPGFGGAVVTAGADQLYGLEGDDILDGGLGGDTLYGGDGADTFIVNDTGDVVFDAEAGDVILASVSYTAGYSPYYFGASRIELTGTADIDASDVYSAAIVGNAGDNRLTGTGSLEGGLGDDVLVGSDRAIASYEQATRRVVVNLGTDAAQDTQGAGIDTISGIHRVRGSAFNDTLVGGVDYSELDGGAGHDTLRGRSSEDTASYASATAGVRVDLSIAGAQDTIGAGRDTLIGIDHLSGSAFADVLRGDATLNYLSGGDGDDVLHAGAQDRLAGGAGADRFVFSIDAQGAIAIDFEGPQGDRIDLSGIDANPFMDGDQAFAIVAAFTGHAGELVIRDDGSIPIGIALDIDGNGAAELGFAVQTYFPLTDTAFIL